MRHEDETGGVVLPESEWRRETRVERRRWREDVHRRTLPTPERLRAAARVLEDAASGGHLYEHLGEPARLLAARKLREMHEEFGELLDDVAVRTS